MSTHDHDVERWSAPFVMLYSLFGRNPASNRAVVEHARVGAGDRVLDIGCGLGAAVEQARHRGADAVGVDPSLSMVKRAARRIPEATLVEGSAEDLPFPDGHFTLVWSISTFHHWASPETGIDEARRVLAPDGRLLIVEKKLKPGKDGHGLDETRAKELSGRLVDRHGFGDSHVETLRARRAEYVVVSARV